MESMARLNEVINEEGNIHELHRRISEVMEVDFVMLQNDKVAAKEIAILEKAKTNIQAETQLKLNELDRRIGELLALPHKD